MTTTTFNHTVANCKNQQLSTKIDKNRQKSSKINKNQPNSTKSIKILKLSQILFHDNHYLQPLSSKLQKSTKINKKSTKIKKKFKKKIKKPFNTQQTILSS